QPFFTPPPEVENNHEYRFYNGGTDARIWQDRFFVYGSAAILGYDPDKIRVDKYGRRQPGDLLFHWFNARQAVFSGPLAFIATDYHLLAVETTRLPELAADECCEWEKLYKRLRVAPRLDWMEEYERLVAEHGADHPRAEWIKQGPLKWSQADWEQWQRRSPEVFAKFAAKSRWMTPLAATEAMILAGRVLVAGGENAVYAIDAADGRIVWSDRTASRVRGLAVSDGRLFVSTIDGCVRCYRTGPAAEAVVHVEKTKPSDSLAKAVLPDACRRVADRIATAWADRSGYCLVLGGGDGRLAYELARRTRLHIHAFDADERQVELARQQLFAAGLHGDRVSISTGDPAQLPFPPYLFNVVIDQTRLCGSDSATLLPEAIRVARPLGGIVYAGSPDAAETPASGGRRPIGALSLRALLPPSADVTKGDSPNPSHKGTGMRETGGLTPAARLSESGHTVDTDDGLLQITRGRLPDSADWTHNYGTSANTYCNEDQRVKGPFGILWYGDPGPRDRIDRHATPPIPLVVDGIMFTTADDRLMAFDVYNGIKYWDRLIPGVDRSGLPIATSNMAAHGPWLYVVVDNRECWQIEARTGKTLHVYQPPARDGQQPNLWAWLATDGRRLYGSHAVAAGNRPDIQHSDEVFAIDVDSGELCWRAPLGRVEHDGIALSEGRLFLVDEGLTEAEQQQATRTLPKDATVPDRPAVDRRGRSVPPDLRKLVALDAATGRPVWQLPFDATDLTLDDTVVSEGRVGVACMVKDGVVIVHGTGSLGHPHREFLAGEFARRALYAFGSNDGRYLWGGRKGYRKRPIIVGQQVFAEPFAWDLKTGRPRTIENPLSGQPQILDFHRGYIGCSHLLASGAALFGNKPGIACWNIDSAEGFVPFDSLVFGCGICATPACGVFVAPEGRSGCTCPAGIHTSLALYPKKDSRAWGTGFTGGIAPTVSLPVRHAAINLGAPGWRQDEPRRLWLPYPARGETGVVGAWLPKYQHKPEQFYYVPAELLPIRGTDQPWLYTSGCQAETDLKFRLIEQGGAAAAYTVRLHFAEPEDLQPGERVFDVRLQDEPVLKGFDIVQAAGAPRRAVVKEFAGVRV
ncbi:MAG: PQQ-binding-like beta-propeller repeat protein, partial [Pirellulaceae bacterium]|nr:PQQ-binding-like beta-propeller repeat protein [Pirellulaceae bacterium]